MHIIKRMFFTVKKIYDDNDDDDVDDDVDYEEITAPLIHNLSIVFLSKLRTIEMYIKKPADFSELLGPIFTRRLPILKKPFNARFLTGFSFAWTVYEIFMKNEIILPMLQYSRGKFASARKSPRCPMKTLAITG